MIFLVYNLIDQINVTESAPALIKCVYLQWKYYSRW